ncbi:MAG: FumA C-terminus/TtdB family hydratase beta subunit [Candidatus ainarchaeum sp.]|nr:FumA C-terminus/TtdB family hydratase beta subunit [Candidatus ainarchaeum sp.]
MNNKKLNTPLDESVELLEAGDKVEITGEIITGRDRVHAFLAESKKELPFSLKGSIIYHVGPIVQKEFSEWKITAAGPTTSIREEIYEDRVIEMYGIKAVMGKGGMGERTKNALIKNNAVYLHAIGGAAALLGKHVEKVLGVYKLEEFGSPEAMWKLQVKDFPAIVTMDSKGNSIHEKIEQESYKKLQELIK